LRVKLVVEAAAPTVLLLLAQWALLTVWLLELLAGLLLLLQRLLHGSLLNVVGKLSGGHSVWFLAVRLELGASELGLSKCCRGVYDGGLARIEGCSKVTRWVIWGWRRGGWEKGR